MKETTWNNEGISGCSHIYSHHKNEAHFNSFLKYLGQIALFDQNKDKSKISYSSEADSKFIENFFPICNLHHDTCLTL